MMSSPWIHLVRSLIAFLIQVVAYLLGRVSRRVRIWSEWLWNFSLDVKGTMKVKVRE